MKDVEVPKAVIMDAVGRHHAIEAKEEMGKKLEHMKNEEIGRTKE